MRRFGALGKAPRARTSPRVAQDRLSEACALRFVNAAQIANPNPLPVTNNQYTADGRFSNCSDPVGSPGVLPIVRYLDSLGEYGAPRS
jgi:hypothetical protein